MPPGVAAARPPARRRRKAGLEGPGGSCPWGLLVPAAGNGGGEEEAVIAARARRSALEGAQLDRDRPRVGSGAGWGKGSHCQGTAGSPPPSGEECPPHVSLGLEGPKGDDGKLFPF